MMDEISKGFFWIPDSSVFSAFSSKYDAGRTGGKFAVAGQQIAGASENIVLNY
jgi:hypothetical protein